MLTTRIPRAESKGESYQQRMIICSKDGSKTATIMHTVNPNIVPVAAAAAGTAPAHVDHAPVPARRKKNKKKGKGTTHSPTYQSTHSTPNGTSEHIDYEDDEDDYVYDEITENRGRGEHRGSIASSTHPNSLSPDDDGLLSDADGGSPSYNPASESKNKKKKKKKRHSDTSHHRHNDIWYKSDAEEKQRIREFWLQLGEDERRALVKLEKEAVLKKMKEQQKQTCSCSVCGRKRTVIEEELEILYDAYYEELENFANDQSGKAPSGPSATPIGHTPSPSRSPPSHRIQHIEEDEEEDGEYDDDDEEEDDDHDPSESIFEFGSSLTVKAGGILTVADDFLKNDGRKFLDLMEQLAERKIRQLDDEMDRGGDNNGDWDDGEYDDEDYDEDEEEDTMTEEQRMEEGRRMFQIFAAKMFEQRVLQAYREKVAQERQMHLLAELEKEKEQQAMRELARQKNKEKKRLQKKALKQQKEEERLALERKKQEEEERLRVEKEAKAEADRLKREAERAKREEERAKREEEERKKKEAERTRKEEEKRRQREAEEKKRREKEERERQERERRERDERERKEKEERDRRERERKEREDREKREKEEKERKEREERERKEKDEKEKRGRGEARPRQQVVVQQQPKTARPVSAKPSPGGLPSKVASHAPTTTPAYRPGPIGRPATVPNTRPPLARPQAIGSAIAQPTAGGSTIRPHSTQPGYQGQQSSQKTIPVQAQQIPGMRPPPSHSHHPLSIHSRPAVGQQNAVSQPGFAHPGSRPLHMFGQPTHMNALHQANLVHGQPTQGAALASSPPPPSTIGTQSLEQADANGIPPSRLFSGASFPALHWSATDGIPAAQIGALGDPARAILAHSKPPVPIGTGPRTDAPVNGIAPIGANKAVTRPAPIRRPSAVAPPAPVQPSRSGFPRLEDDEPVAGSAVLGGELLKDDERIGGGAAWRKPSSAGIPSIGPNHGAGGPDPFGQPTSGAPGVLGVVNGAAPGPARMFDGYGPFGGWDVPSTLGGGLGEDISRTQPSSANVAATSALPSAIGRGVSNMLPPGPGMGLPFYPSTFMGGSAVNSGQPVGSPPTTTSAATPASTMIGRPGHLPQPVSVHGPRSAWNGGRE
ncbi:uncharacterized protein SPPG_05356 [Spizellomyces punctatus DAOM BR117]|uniref:Stress response protein NST1 n=1 Tax=Spizellomyces punctatus (strain DAOM BR117) TaxID=645134 RepID=A0A0L0HG22_SPIPD|nr:uncharacterized protein SPPG_05356 [Spizellomyces punctatus DAOM BR117]KNC99981.1 hypothetical protein SPPG_05356 [Spizellomyces punctatus DAOM BR117]|eukprot:XP_016608021.1 hypothetical protein SPPG_05356 [Spizellomyces punctatus DAOM BR117]